MATSTHPHLNHAPITEAILDIKVETKAAIGEVDEFARNVAGTYPGVTPLKTTSAVITPDAAQAAVSHNVIGKICWNSAKTRAVQARINGFTINHVRDYDSWEALRAEAQSMWLKYLAALRPTRVRRIGLRYINRVVFPENGTISQYAETRPQLGPDLPQEIPNFFMRVEVPFSETERALITQTAAPSPDGRTHGIILDIDAVSMKELDPQSPEVWNVADRLREIKNRCFFGSLQEKAWRQYEK